VIHLGDRIAAFVDGELPHEARDRVLTHLTTCPECRAAADAERAAKARVAAIEGPGPSDDLTRRLLALAEPGEPLPPRRRGVGRSTRAPSVPVGGPVGGPVSGPLAAGPLAAGPRPPGLRSRNPRLQFFAAASVGVVAVALGAAVVIGGREQPGPALGPGDDWFAVEHAATTGGLPLVDPAMSMTIGFSDLGGQSLGGAGAWGGAPITGAYFGEVSPR